MSPADTSVKERAVLRQQKDMLLRLASCSGTTLFLLVCGSRILVLLAMLVSYAVLPRLLNAELVLDTSGLLHNDTVGQWAFLDFPRNWDGVHFSHIANYGYSHENNCAFFPFVPCLFQILSWLNKLFLLAPFAVIPVSFQVAVLNAVLNGVSAIFLRRITVLTLLRPETTGRGRFGGTWLDELPPPPPPRHGSRKEKDRDGDVKLRLRRELGAVLLMWIMSPTLVFTVVAYTESFFCCLTFAGLHLLLVSSEECRKFVAASAEAGAVFCFFLAGWARSNAFLYVGFMLYPTMLQIFFFDMYRRRYIQCHGSYKLCRRWPSAGRCLVLFIEIFIICAPFLCMNYFCFNRFAPLWDSTTRVAIGNRFWSFYGLVQKRYWNVEFLGSYTMKNLPNVFIAAPVVFFTLRGIMLFYVLPAFTKASTALFNEGARRGSEGRRNDKGGNKILFSCVSLLGRLVKVSVQSSNMAYLVVSIFFGVSMMHINVVNRFIMSSPALYWIWARQLVWDPWGGCTIVMLRFFVVWTCIGILFFPNSMPWT
ncbi:hypothetical protein TRSC58_04943 [Trypanosoma rangeli SC58]|uniref:GPI mannosyltransferase 2 n=1 Tax=Trypanosoma rangeli SC58 TaxID=429131 RepID=A0A061J246_TRYRA|nr:hypothetical protein TRSC58_04943 [Trypanosoma rangeli SC58]